MANEHFPKVSYALDVLAQEDTTLLHKANKHHQSLIWKYLDSFPPAFHKIQLHGYITKALEDKKTHIRTKTNLYTTCTNLALPSMI